MVFKPNILSFRQIIMSIEDRRQLNERKFPHWEKLGNDGRKYCLEVKGRHGWRARYVKEVNAREETTRFYQEIYNDIDKLMEIHEKAPVDDGHRNVGE